MKDLNATRGELDGVSISKGHTHPGLAITHKLKLTKSRNGCLTCKKKRRKCDETKPKCLNCSRRNINCGGYLTEYKWKTFGDPLSEQPGSLGAHLSGGLHHRNSGSSAGKPQARDRYKALNAVDEAMFEAMRLIEQPNARDTHANGSVNLNTESPSPSEIITFSIDPDLKVPLARTSTEPQPPASHLKHVNHRNGTDGPLKRHPTQSDSALLPVIQRWSEPIPPPHLLVMGSAERLHPSHPEPASMSLKEYGPRPNSPPQVLDWQRVRKPLTMRAAGASPHHPEPLEQPQRFPREVTLSLSPPTPLDAQAVSTGDIIISRPVESEAPTPVEASPNSFTALINTFKEFENASTALFPSDLDLPALLPVHQPCHRGSLPEMRSSPFPQPSGSKPENVPFVSTRSLSCFPELEMETMPTVVPTSEYEQIIDSYQKHTCRIMSIIDGPTENPWRSLILPLAQKHKVLFSAIASMTYFHIARGDQAVRARGVQHMSDAITRLREGLRGGSLPSEVALATCLSLGVGECWNHHTSSGMTHLKGAKRMIREVLLSYSARGTSMTIPRSVKFLLNCWMYFNVMARITSNDTQEGGAVGEAPLLEEFSHLQEDDQAIDPLLGVTQTLFPLINEVASLVGRIRDLLPRPNTLMELSQATELKNKLQRWKPLANLLRARVEDPSWDLPSCLASAEAYRYATLLYLHQAVPELPSPSSHDLAAQVFTLLASIPITSPTRITHLYPLFIASCEAETTDERAWVLHRWREMVNRMWIGNVAKACEVVQEVWLRKDHHNRASSNTSSSLHTARDPETLTTLINRAVAMAHGGSVEAEPLKSTLRSPSHWCTIMREWDWEVLLA